MKSVRYRRSFTSRLRGTLKRLPSMRASSNVRGVKGSSSPSSRSSSSEVSHGLWLGAYLVCVEIRSYEAPPDANSASICSLRSGCVGATTISTLRPWFSSNSARRVYRGSYIGPPTIEPSSVRSSEDLSYAGGDGFAQLSVLAGVEVDAVYVAGDDDLGGVEELAPVLLGEALVVPAELPGFLLSSIEHLCHVGESRDRGRGDQDHNGSAAIRPASAPQHHVGQACSPLRDVRGGASEARLEVVGPKHQRYKVEGTVRLETRHQVSPAVLVIPLYRIIPHRRPARQALFDHTIFLTQPHSEHPRPAYVLGKALPRLGVRAPGVRVPVT